MTSIAARQFSCAQIALAFSVLMGFSTAADAGIRNRYSFDNPAGPAVDGLSVIEDSVGPHDGVVRGAGGAFTGTQLQLPGGSQAAGGAYVDLPNGMISSITTDATFEAWYSINAATNWARIFDFGDRDELGIPTEIEGPSFGSGVAGDTIFFAPSRSSNIDQQRVAIENDSAAGPVPGMVGGQISSGNSINFDQTLGEQVHMAVVLVKDADGAGPNVSPRLTVFMNGGQVFTVAGNAANPHQLQNLNDINNWLGRSNYAGDAQLNGFLNEFRIYDQALTAGQVGFSFLTGPDTLFVPEPTAIALAICGLIASCPIIGRRKRTRITGTRITGQV